MSNKYYLVVDTETGNGLGNPLIYDIAWIIYDENHNIVTKRNYIIKRIFNHIQQGKITAYYKQKLNTYYMLLLRNNPNILKNLGYAITVLNRDIVKYNPVIMAYNLPFDIKALQSSANYNIRYGNGKEWHLLSDIKKLDILDMVKATIKKDDSIEWKYKTKKGNNSYNAENVYRHIIGNSDFVESHTALDDCIIEGDIVRYIVQQYNYDLWGNV